MFGKNKKEKRFIVKEEQGFAMGAISVIVDTVTGVNYIATYGGGPSAITPLLDANGKVVVDTLPIKK